MKLPMRLRRQARAESAAALLLPSEDAGALLRLCAQVGQDPAAHVYRVPGGFLVKLSNPSPSASPGCIRLRCAAENLYLPAGGAFVPGLLPDEAADLTRRRGLVFLPGGRVLSFDPQRPVTLSSLLDPGPVERKHWQPFPEPRPVAERLREIRLELPPVPPETILEAGAGDIGSEAPRPPASGGVARGVGGASVGLGRALHWLGNTLRFRGLAALGARLIGGGLRLAPRLSETLLGRQEAALRELLRHFREGKLEQALRRALPLGGEPGRGSVPAGNANLPVHRLRYSLSGLLGNGPASVWFGGLDVQVELAREYRKAAEQATHAGDYRRAAFIYGKLLADYRPAADVLLRGGLFHDAAILYLDKLNDVLAAARAFAAAGEIDRALELYRRRGEHLLAADLLRKSGEEEEAVVEYTIAADLLVAKRRDYLGAGNLMLEHVGRADLARRYYAAGWAACLRPNAVSCGRRLARLHATHGEIDDLRKLMGEAEHFFALPGDEASAGSFFNEIAELADRPEVASIRDELRDRALLGIAAKMRERSCEVERPGRTVSLLLGQSPAWPPALVHDADFAYRSAFRRSEYVEKEMDDRGVTRLRVGNGTVTAVCFAPETGEMFLGFDNGAVDSFHPSTSRSVTYPPQRTPVSALACDARATFLAVFRSHDGESGIMDAYVRMHDQFWLSGQREISGSGGCRLSPQALLSDGDLLLALHDGDRLVLLRGSQMLPVSELLQPFEITGLSAVLLLPVPGTHTPAPFATAVDAILPCTSTPDPMYARLGGRPGIRDRSTLRNPTIAIHQSHPRLLDLAGVTADGVVFWAALEWKDGRLETRTTASATMPAGYFAAAFARSNLLAAVCESGIHWYRGGAGKLTLWRTTRIDLPGVVACQADQRTHMFMAVLSDGQVVSLSVPD